MLFPRLSDGKLQWLADRGERRTFRPGEVLYEHAVRDAPFYVIERGLVELVDRFRGAGVCHAAMATDAERCRDEDVIVVGGGNSAGQAAVHLASRARSVRIVVRGTALKSTMSQYLVDRIERSPRIECWRVTIVRRGSRASAASATPGCWNQTM